MSKLIIRKKMKRMLIAANWKMNNDINQTKDFLENLKKNVHLNLDPNVEVLVCPSFTNLSIAQSVVENSRIVIGSQNCYFQSSGAFTGEISISMLESVGCEYTIIGHSERRSIFGEDDELINQKLTALLDSKINPILCIGESLEERNNAKTFERLSYQISKAFNQVQEDKFHKIVIAYEPIWAIGTGLTASTEQINETHNWIVEYLSNNFGPKAALIPILYGGSLNEKNCEEILKIKHVNGGLIGGASLKLDSYLTIIRSANKIINSI